MLNIKYPKCRVCGAAIWFAKNSQGHNVPIDAGSLLSQDDYLIAHGQTVQLRHEHMLHFRTCSNPQALRTKKRRTYKPVTVQG